MGQDLLLGIDIGTYESKGVLTTTKGEVIAQAAITARAGSTATAGMMPKHGRAGWIGERVKGIEDAEANVVAVVFEALT